MRNWWVGCVLCVFGFSVLAKPLMKIQKVSLDHGAHLYLVSSHDLPVVDVRVTFRAGSSYDGHMFGLANMTNALMNEGSGGKSADEVANELSDEGAQVNFSSGRLMGSLSLRSMSDEDHLKKSLAIFHRMLMAPNFSEKAFVRVQNQMLAAIKFKNQDPQVIASQHFFNALYPHLPYAHAPLGTESGLKLIHLEQVKRFYKKFYVRANAQVIMIGDIQLEEAKALANELLRGMSDGRRAPNLPQAPQLKDAKHINVSFPSSQMTYYLGQAGVSRKDPDYLTWVVANEVLGGSYQQSRLFDVLRNNHGLVYSINSLVVPYPFGGPMLIIFQTKDESATQALALVNRTVHYFALNALTEPELALVKRLLVGRLYRQLVSNEDKLSMVSILAFYDLPLNYYDEYVRHIEQVTVKDIIDVFSKKIHADRWVTVRVGDSEQEQAK